MLHFQEATSGPFKVFGDTFRKHPDFLITQPLKSITNVVEHNCVYPCVMTIYCYIHVYIALAFIHHFPTAQRRHKLLHQRGCKSPRWDMPPNCQCKSSLRVFILFPWTTERKPVHRNYQPKVK